MFMPGRQRDEWDEQAPEGRVAQALEAQLVKLIILEKKTPGDFKEIDLLMRQRSVWLKSTNITMVEMKLT